MKKVILIVALFVSAFTANSQTDINLNLNHYWNNSVFNYGDQYTDASGRIIEISRVQYYLSAFSINHDGGQTTDIADSYLLASGNVTNYSIGTATFTNLESIDFDLGIDAATNHLDPALQSSTHPLSIQSPAMHWGWTAGYRFLVIEGKIDDNNDGVANKSFQFHVTANDAFLRSVTTITTSGAVNGSDLDINLDVNIADWLVGIDLATAGLNHGDFPVNGTVMDNTNDYEVFNTNIGLGVDEAKPVKNNVYFDYSLPYAPTIFYKFPLAESVSLKIVDLQGKTILTESVLIKAGNYFINKELADGTYIAVFTTNTGTMKSEKFIVRN